jgi:molybdenum cofactor biosynthesis enzyme MoaA
MTEVSATASPCTRILNHLGFYDDTIGFCCCTSSDFHYQRPQFPYLDTAEETITNFFNHKNAIIEELKGLKKVNAAKACVNCSRMGDNFVFSKDELKDTKIRHIAVSCYPSVCQAKCFYCQEYGKPKNTYQHATQSIYPKIIAEIIHILRKKCLIAKNCKVTIAPAEITITPHKDLLLDAISGFKSRFISNCFIFEQKIADSLKCNESVINVSLDSGTRETFRLVKGLDMFCEVMENLKRYRSHGNVEVKYVVIPGVNDDIKDYAGVAAILKSLDIDTLVISFDYFLPLRTSLYSIAELVRMLTENGLGFKFHTYYSTDKIKSYIEEYITPSSRKALKNKHNLLKQEFNSLYTDDYEAYKKYIYSLEIKELVNYFAPGTRFALLGGSAANEFIQSAFEELQIPLHLSTAPYIEAYNTLKDSTDIFIIYDKGYFTCANFHSSYTNDEKVRFLDIERYFFSFDPARTFAKREIAKKYLMEKE